MQAFLITAYKDKQQLLRLINKVNRIGKVFVHIDKKSSEISVDDMKDLDIYNTIFISCYSIYWGNYNHVKAIIKLMNLAAEDNEITYIHLISGQDYPVKTLEDFEDKFTSCDEIYMSCSDDSIFGQEITDRFTFWYPITNGNPQSFYYRAINKVFLKMQELLGIRRKRIGEFTKIYKGMIWASMPREVLIYVLKFWKENKNFQSKMKHIRLCEEFLFQTILMNSQYSDKVVKDSLRYNDWEHAVGGSPATVTEENYINIIQSNNFFARKMETGKSESLIRMIEEK